MHIIVGHIGLFIRCLGDRGNRKFQLEMLREYGVVCGVGFLLRVYNWFIVLLLHIYSRHTVARSGVQCTSYSSIDGTTPFTICLAADLT